MTRSGQSIIEASNEGGGDGPFRPDENGQAQQPHGEVGEAHLADDRNSNFAWDLKYLMCGEFRLNDLADACDEEAHSYGPEGEPPTDKDKDLGVWMKVNVDGNGDDRENKQEQNYASKIQSTLPWFARFRWDQLAQLCNGNGFGRELENGRDYCTST